jgi:hypothetical protein
LHQSAGLGIGMKELGDLADVGFELLVLVAVHQVVSVRDTCIIIFLPTKNDALPAGVRHFYPGNAKNNA